ncbi:MAG: histidine ammonia-lyase [Candidatus Hodarchaeales archaeon]
MKILNFETTINGKSLTLEDVINVSRRQNTRIRISTDAIEAVKSCRDFIDALIAKKDENSVIYGVTTGFGDLVSQRISPDQLEALQENLVISHCAGTGETFPDDIIVGAMVLRLNSLVKGNSGVRIKILELLRDFINANIIPHVPAQGSLGASGDLCPLAHVAITLIGKGYVKDGNALKKTMEVLKEKKLQPVTLKAKEGLALLNGSQFIASMACHIVHDAAILQKVADIVLAMSLEALKGTPTAFDSRITGLRPFQGSQETASNVRKMIQESKLLDHSRVQDAYSIRCAPQVHGTVREAFRFIRSMVEVEINSVTDNPLVFPKDKSIISGGNFHGQPLAMTLDLSSIALNYLANISERRIARLVNKSLSLHLPPFLIANDPGLNSGFMIAHYTAASLVSENKSLSHPASVDSIPVSAGQEDHVSMGTIAGRKALQILENSFNVLSIELLAATQALDFIGPEKAGKGIIVAHEFVRNLIPHVERDRSFYKDINKIKDLLKRNELIKAVEREIGKLE